MFIDPLYILFALPALLLGIIAQILLKIWTSQYFKKTPISNFNGAQTVEKISNNHNFDISLALTNQHLGDNYNPTNKVLTLSRDIAEKSSITSVGIAAHELGHVQQHMTGSLLIRMRSTLVPVLNIGTNIGYFMLIGGIIQMCIRDSL